MIKTAKPGKTNTTKSVSDIVGKTYAVGVSNHARSTMKSTDPAKDPIAAQYIPQLEELLVTPEQSPDPIGDNAHSPVKGIVHRYPDRALYKITNICPVYCRYCFRKSMVGPGNETLKKSERDAAIQYIKNTPAIWEVILTGGDPLILSAAQIKDTLDDLEAIKHVQTMRIHTRTPIADPARINDGMISALTRNKTLTIVLHINHAQELTAPVINCIKNMRAAGALLMTQSVLLKGVNDSAETLETLFRKLISIGVKPYMLHHLDYAPGTEHFRVPISTGQSIMQQLRGNLSGIALPEYMLDIPGGYGKVPLTPSHCTAHDDGTHTIIDRNGKTHAYPPKEAS